MNFNKEWQAISEQKFSNHKTEKDMILQAIKSESKSTISTLKKNLKKKINWIIFFIIAYIVFSIVKYDNPLILACMGYLIISYAIGGLALWRQYKQMDKDTDYSGSILHVMKKNLQLIKSALKHETVFGVLTFPAAIVAGVIIGNDFQNKTCAALIDSLTDPIKIAIYLALMVGVGFLAHFMNKVAYGSDIKTLENQISQLEGVT